MVFLSLVLATNKLYNKDAKNSEIKKLLLAWIIVTSIWKFTTVLLEEKGYNMFLYLWVISVVFFILNSYIIVLFIKN